jgi:hypothetical protein
MNLWIKLAAATALGLVVCASSTTAQEKSTQDQDGWVSLFDGQTISGWEMLELNPQRESRWEVKDGVIVGTGYPSMLYSPKGDYRNFRFRAEVKINDRGNSGMYVRTAKKRSFTDGYEIQVNATHSDPIRTGSLYTVQVPDPAR